MFDTMELNLRIYAYSKNAYLFSPFHGTPLRKIAEEQGYIKPGTIARSATKPTVLNMPHDEEEKITD